MSEASSLSSLDPSRLPPVGELQNTRIQVEKEIEFLTSSHGQLVDAKAKCLDNITMIDHIGSISEGQEMLAAITNSMFIPVKLKDNSRVMTDIGTGFLVERSGTDAQEYYKRKTDTIMENMKKVEGAMVNKQNAMKCIFWPLIIVLNEAMRIKVEAEQSKS
jgi:prefoldin alpha subunit